MEVKSICGGKYKLNIQKQVIYLPVKLANLPQKIKIGEDILLKRTEFHVSLVCIKKIIEKYNISIPDFKDKIINDFCEFAEKNEVIIINYSNEFKFVAKEGKKTVVVMCTMLNLDKFFDIVNRKYLLGIESPPAHVTLYTLDGKPGAYLISANDIKNFTKPIQDPIGHPL